MATKTADTNNCLLSTVNCSPGAHTATVRVPSQPGGESSGFPAHRGGAGSHCAEDRSDPAPAQRHVRPRLRPR